MSKTDQSLKQKITKLVLEIEEKMTDRIFKKSLEYTLKELLAISRQNSEPFNEIIGKTFKKMLINSKLETKLATLMLIFTIVNQIPEKNKSEYSNLVDLLESEIAPCVFNILCTLIKDVNGECAKNAEGYKFDIRILSIMVILMFFKVCESKFSIMKGHRARKFETFIENLEIPPQIKEKFDSYSNITMNLIENRTNYFEKQDQPPSADFSKKLEQFLKDVARSREELIQCFNPAEPIIQEKNDFDKRIEAYKASLFMVKEHISDKVRFIPGHLKVKIDREDEFGKFIFDELVRVIQTDQMINKKQIFDYIVTTAGLIFEVDQENFYVVPKESVKVPKLKTFTLTNENSNPETFEENSHVFDDSNTEPKEIINNFQVQNLTGTISEQCSPIYITPKRELKYENQDNNDNQAKVYENFGDPLDKPKLSLQPNDKNKTHIANKDQDQIRPFVEAKASGTRQKLSMLSNRELLASADIYSKTKGFNDIFNEELDNSLIKETSNNRMSYQSGVQNQPSSKNQKIINLSALEKEKLKSSSMDRKSIAKLSFGANKLVSKTDQNDSGERRNIIGDAFFKVSNITSHKKDQKETIKSRNSHFSPHKDQKESDINNKLTSSQVYTAKDEKKLHKSPRAIPFLSVYQESWKEIQKKSEEVVNTPIFPLNEGKTPENNVFDFNDFDSASDKLETPPERSLQDQSNILPPSLKGIDLKGFERGRSGSNYYIPKNDPEATPWDQSQNTIARKKTLSRELNDPRGTPIEMSQGLEIFPSNRSPGGRITLKPFIDPNYSAIDYQPNISKYSSNDDISDHRSQADIDENIIKTKVDLEHKISKQKQEFQIMLEKMRQNPSSRSQLNSEHEKEIEVYKQFIQKITSDYETLLANNKQETKELRIIIEETNLQNEKYKHKTFNAENELISLKEENERLKKYFKSQKSKYEQNIAKQKEQIAKTMESKIAFTQKSTVDKIKAVTDSANSEVLKFKTAHHDLESELNDMRVEMEVIKNKKLTEIYFLKEKIQQLRQGLTQLKSDYETQTLKVSAILESRKCKESGLVSIMNVAIQNDLLEKLKSEQRKNEELRRHLMINTTEPNIYKSNLTFSQKMPLLEGKNSTKFNIKLSLGNLRESIMKFQTWIMTIVQELGIQLQSLKRQNKLHLLKRISNLEASSQFQMKEVTKYKFQIELLNHDYNRVKEKNRQLLEEIQNVKNELSSAKKERFIAPKSTCDVEMMKKHHEVQLENKALNELNKRNIEEILQLTEKVTLAETNTRCSIQIMEAAKKLEQENEELMEINKALYNELFQKKGRTKMTADTHVQILGLKKEIDQLKYLNSQMIARLPNIKDNRNVMIHKASIYQTNNEEWNNKRYSNVTGTAFIKKFDLLMHHLNFDDNEKPKVTILDWILQRTYDEQERIAKICTLKKYFLTKTEHYKIHVSENIRFEDSCIIVSIDFMISNLTSSQILIEYFKINCESKFVSMENAGPFNISLYGFEEKQQECKIIFDPNYLYNIQPICVSFTLLGKPFLKRPTSVKHGLANMSSIPLPITINKLVQIQKEDSSKFTIIQALQLVGEITLENQKEINSDCLYEIFPELCEVSIADSIFGLKISSFFGMFFMTIVLSPASIVNIKLFGMFGSPLHDVFLKTVAMIINLR